MSPFQQLALCPGHDPRRPALEALIQGAFERRHGAQIHHFMPSLVGLWGAAGAPVGAAGLRSASQEPLFLENYLDRPVEIELAAVSGKPVLRSEVVEVGNLAGVTCRAACRLVAALPPLLLSQGHRWIVFTATDTVRSVLNRLGAPLFEIASARADRAPPGDHWGHYYTHDPRVMAGYLPSLR